MIIERLKSGVITVGHGRGFVVEGAGERLVITAAHCLPSLPLALPSFGLEARTYGPLLARRGEEPPFCDMSAYLFRAPAQAHSAAATGTGRAFVDKLNPGTLKGGHDLG